MKFSSGLSKRFEIFREESDNFAGLFPGWLGSLYKILTFPGKSAGFI